MRTYFSQNAGSGIDTEEIYQRNTAISNLRYLSQIMIVDQDLFGVKSHECANVKFQNDKKSFFSIKDA